MPYLESISPSRSTMLEDCTRLDGETPLTESGKERLVTYGLFSSNGVEACRVLPISANHGKRYLHREIVRKRQTKRERVSERTCFRAIELERDQVSEREKERERERESVRKRGRTGEIVR